VSGQWIDGQVINPSGEMNTYSVDARAGDRLYFDLRNVTPRVYAYNPALGTYRYNYSGAVRLLDPNGNMVASGSEIVDTEWVASVSGRYTIEFDDSLANLMLRCRSAWPCSSTARRPCAPST
jgi:hypothetical protein